MNSFTIVRIKRRLKALLMDAPERQMTVGTIIEALAADGFRASPDVLQVIVNGSSQRMFDYVDDGNAIHLLEDGGDL
ncbi:MAG: hypothetical protein J0I17_00780 ['Candidatus Kapabacteria' thiocyanatum]|uniref:Uncharacterized protein n=1 Tax=Candidatus Kapaibacterium thiocyanatum TaxID=1895771 RepID=A0A1M3KWH2_9BACT|nr:hypothetical protein ['Candidatus Kapabacteria' thiocyanatum]OJX56725.1 MAG: hypothetical protein BGO89_09300 ['Candidatus Kapabacteria' thiocyanatum]